MWAPLINSVTACFIYFSGPWVSIIERQHLLERVSRSCLWHWELCKPLAPRQVLSCRRGSHVFTLKDFGEQKECTWQRAAGRPEGTMQGCQVDRDALLLSGLEKLCKYIAQLLSTDMSSEPQQSE